MLAGDTSLHHYQQNIRAGAKQTILFSEVKANITSETFLVASDIQGLRSGSIREIRLEKGDLSLVKAACAKARNCMQLCPTLPNTFANLLFLISSSFPSTFSVHFHPFASR